MDLRSFRVITQAKLINGCTKVSTKSVRSGQQLHFFQLNKQFITIILHMTMKYKRFNQKFHLGDSYTVTGSKVVRSLAF